MSDATLLTLSELEHNASDLASRIMATGVEAGAVTVLAVTKTFPIEVVALARSAGFVDLGENYPQELAKKAAATSQDVGIRWHAIGQLQRNKVKLIAPFVALWQTVDRVELVETIARHSPSANVLVQINLTNDPHRGGCRLSEVESLVTKITQAGLVVQGLMTVGPLPGEGNASAGFRAVRAMVDELGLSICSMGMSDDFEIALGEGSTMIRIGSALFGKRHS